MLCLSIGGELGVGKVGGKVLILHPSARVGLDTHPLPKVNSLAHTVDLCNLLCSQIPDLFGRSHVADTFLVARASHADLALGHNPEDQDASCVNLDPTLLAQLFSELGEDGLEGSTGRVGVDGREGSVGLADDVVLLLQLENGFYVGEDVGVELEL